MAGDNPMLYCLIEDMVDEQDRDDEDGDYDEDDAWAGMTGQIEGGTWIA